MRKGDVVLIILAVLLICVYGWFLYLHDERSDMAIQTEDEISFNGGFDYENQ